MVWFCCTWDTGSSISGILGADCHFLLGLAHFDFLDLGVLVPVALRYSDFVDQLPFSLWSLDFLITFKILHRVTFHLEAGFLTWNFIFQKFHPVADTNFVVHALRTNQKEQRPSGLPTLYNVSFNPKLNQVSRLNTKAVASISTSMK